jgi:hypothetical protein
VPHVVENDKSLTPICNCDGEEVVINLDGDDSDGIDDGVQFIIYDGGSATGI